MRALAMSTLLLSACSSSYEQLPKPNYEHRVRVTDAPGGNCIASLVVDEAGGSWRSDCSGRLFTGFQEVGVADVAAAKAAFAALPRPPGDRCAPASGRATDSFEWLYDSESRTRWFVCNTGTVPDEPYREAVYLMRRLARED